LALIALAAGACISGAATASSSPSASTATALSPIAIPTRSSDAPTSGASPSAGQPTFAVVCGVISEFVSDTPVADGFLVLTAPGRDPMRFTIPAGQLGGRAANYVCISVQRGNPYPRFDGFVPSGTLLFVDAGRAPATSASPAPAGFLLPPACAFVAPPPVMSAQTEWSIDCGSERNRDARGVLTPELQRQGWTECASGLASAQWRKNDVTLTISESSLAPGDFPRIAQSLGACR
jgi:hypothetical protein